MVRPHITLELRPFEVPTHVYRVSRPGLRQDGFKPIESYPLSDLDAETLDIMCDAFRAAVFASAGIDDTINNYRA